MKLSSTEIIVMVTEVFLFYIGFLCIIRVNKNISDPLAQVANCLNVTCCFVDNSFSRCRKMVTLYICIGRRAQNEEKHCFLDGCCYLEW